MAIVKGQRKKLDEITFLSYPMGDMSKNSERRKRVRVPIKQNIKHSRYQVLGTPVFEENSAIDLSTTGMAFETTQEYKKGALILLEVKISEEPLKLLVCVAWVKKIKGEHPRYQVGAELIAIDPEHKKQMHGHLAKLIAHQAKPKTKAKKKTAKKKTAKKKIVKKESVKKNVRAKRAKRV